MTDTDVPCPQWHKSSYSNQNGACVEVARNLPGVVAIRDSKDPHGAVLVVTREAWQTFLRRTEAP